MATVTREREALIAKLAEEAAHLAKVATNTWACVARSKRDFDVIGGLHRDINAVREKLAAALAAPPAEDALKALRVAVMVAVSDPDAEWSKVRPRLAEALNASLTAAQAPPASDAPDGPRPENGPMQFGDDWAGVFLRGDCALPHAFSLRQVLQGAPPDRMGLSGLIRLLESCDERAGVKALPQRAVLVSLAAQAPPASDPPGLVALVAEYQREHAKHESSRRAGRWPSGVRAAHDALLAYPLPASPQAETTKGDE